MKTSSFGPAALGGRVPGLSGAGGHGPVGGASALAPAQAPQVTPELSQIRYASTWPRGWMAAAVPQRVREFNVQASKAQLALAFLDRWDAQLQALHTKAQHQQQLPSPAGQARAQTALDEARSTWQQRHHLTWASLDEQLRWSPVHSARKQFTLQGWDASTLLPQASNDRELVAFCLMGFEAAHGAWMPLPERGPAAARFALASALAPLLIQLDAVTPQHVLLSTDERYWPQVLSTCMVRGNGRRFPAGQWVAPGLGVAPGSVQLASWQVADEAGVQAVLEALPALRERVAQVRAQVQQFCAAAGDSVAHAQPDQLQRMQAFAQAFASAGQAPAYDWVLAVVPAVRAMARSRVARLLQRPLRSL